LKDIAEYIIKKAIPNLVNDLINNSENNKLADSKSVSEMFHINGVNMRYLGHVIGLIK
jgi:hypothetical protein